MAVPMQSRKKELKRNTIEPTFAVQEWPAMPRAAITVAELECGAYTVKPRYEKNTRLPKEPWRRRRQLRWHPVRTPTLHCPRIVDDGLLGFLTIRTVNNCQ